MNSYTPSKLNQIKRIPKKAEYSRKVIYQIIDEALYCHIGIIHENRPIVIPTIHTRVEDFLFIHGSNNSRLIKASNQNNMCVSITLMDGLVIARSLFHSTMHYRSVVLFGTGNLIQNEHERLEALKSISDHIVPGRWKDARQPNAKELKQTAIIKMPIDHASAKISSGPLKDEKEDYDSDFWAGIIPIKQTYDTPQPDPKLKRGIPIPSYLERYTR